VQDGSAPSAKEDSGKGAEGDDDGSLFLNFSMNTPAAKAIPAVAQSVTVSRVST